MFRIMFIVVSLLCNCSCRNALEYFLANRKILNATFVLISNTTSPDHSWIEYTYYYQDIKITPKKIIKNLTVGVFDGLEFDCQFLNHELFGYTFEVMKLLREFSIGIHYRKVNDSNNLSELLISGEIDLLACHPNIDFNSYSGIRPLIPTLESDYVLIYDPNKLDFTKDIFILTFAGTLWICFLVLLIVLAICLHLSTKQYSFLDLKYEPWSWVDITLWANAAACQQGLSHTPNGFASRLIFFLGYALSYLLYTGFAAGITSLLLQQGMGKDITANDIQKMDIKVVTLKNHEYHGSDAKNGTLTVSNIEDVFLQIHHHDIVGIIPILFIEQYHAKHVDSDVFSIYGISKLKSAHYSRSFLMRRGETYTMINNILFKLKETGVLSKILKESLLMSPNNINLSNYSSAGIEHVGSAITILVIGTLSSTIFLVFELIFALYSGKL